MPVRLQDAAAKSVSTSPSWNAATVMVICGLVAVLSSVLSFAAEVLQRNAGERAATYVYILTGIAFVLNIVAIPATHELSGKTAHPRFWRFYQPWRGGVLFVTLQFVSWALFVVAIVHVLTWAYTLVHAYSIEMRSGLLSTAGLVSLGSEFFMLLSITRFKSESLPLTVRAAAFAERIASGITSLALSLRRTAVVAAFCNMPFLLLSWIVLPGLLLTPHAAAIFYAVSFGGYILQTYRNSPHVTGSRRWDWFRRSWIIQDVVEYFQGDIVKEVDLDPEQKYIFAFAPHGIMTLTAIWSILHRKFESFFPGQDVVPLGASIFQMVPLVRDGPAWVGTRQVGRSSFIRTLDEGHSVLVVPGGVKEMRLSRSWDNTIRLYTHHKGFVRLALEQGVDLVPMFSFGETRYFDMLHVPVLSDLLLKYIGTPIPYFVGRGNVLQLPRPQKVTVVYGAPIKVEKIESPTQEQVDEVHRAFYGAVHAIFDRHKSKYEHESCKLELVGMNAPDHKTRQD